MERYKKDWVKTWNVKTIVGQAVSLGMEFMAIDNDEKDLLYNKNLLIKELNRKINKII